MVRLCAVLLYVVLRLAMKIAIDTVVGLWLKYRPIRRWRTRRAKRAEHPDEILEDFNSQPDEVSMDAVKGALRSRLIWLGVAQVVYGLVQLWADGMLTIESAGPVLGGAVTIWLRAVTKDSLADKAK